MYTVKKLSLFNLAQLNTVNRILYNCGKDMAEKYGLQHWNNSKLKNAIIIALCALKNKIYLVFDGTNAIATFQIKKQDDIMCFQKLATDPHFSGKGIGSFCLQKIESMAENNNCKRVRCEVYDKSEHAKAFYEHRGYTVYGQTETLKYTELKMEKVL